jgi:phage gp36-like protein
VTDTIEKVSGEITDILAHRYKLTVTALPQVIVNKAAVFSAYRIVEAITGIVSTEAGADNVWIPLQKEYQRMDRILNEIAKGTLKLNIPEISGGKTVAVVNPEIELEGY